MVVSKSGEPRAKQKLRVQTSRSFELFVLPLSIWQNVTKHRKGTNCHGGRALLSCLKHRIAQRGRPA